MVAAVGSCLADLLAGYVTYAPITFIIKGIMGLVAGHLLQKKTRSVAYSALLLLLLQAFMVLGYFLFEAILYGMPAGERILVNDCKPSGLLTAVAVNKKRDDALSIHTVLDESL